MRQERIILLLVIVMVVLSILLITGVGYAVETDNTLKIAKHPCCSMYQHFILNIYAFCENPK